MRFLVDTNVLVEATFAELPGHGAALDFLQRVLASDRHWCLTWVNAYEYLRVVTHPHVFARPLQWGQAYDQVTRLLSHPGLTILAETERHVTALRSVVESAGGASGNFVHDCHIAALMSEHDISRIVTSDSNFRRFSGVEALVPAVAVLWL